MGPYTLCISLTLLTPTPPIPDPTGNEVRTKHDRKSNFIPYTVHQNPFNSILTKISVAPYLYIFPGIYYMSIHCLYIKKQRNYKLVVRENRKYSCIASKEITKLISEINIIFPNLWEMGVVFLHLFEVEEQSVLNEPNSER